MYSQIGIEPAVDKHKREVKMFYHNLNGRKKDTTSIALIGTGHFGTAVLIQSLVIDDLRVAAIADKNADAIRTAAAHAGLGPDRIRFCETKSEIVGAMDCGAVAAVSDAMLLMDLPIDTIVEGTGNPEAGARHAEAAIRNGKNVVIVSKETDSCVGPILRKHAEDNGVVYTPVDGDQHGALIELIDWARSLGLHVVCGGKSRDAEFIYDSVDKTVTVYRDNGITIKETKTVQLDDSEVDLFENLGDDPAGRIALRKKILDKLDKRGGFDLCEMVIAANAAGLRPDTELLHDAVIRTSEITDVLCMKEDGGILSTDGAIEVVTDIHEKREAGLGGGVFIVVHADNDYSQMILNTKGCISNRKGSVALVYKPYHLCGVEAATTLVAAGIYGISLVDSGYRQNFDIVQEAVIDLKAGDIVGNDHDERFLTHMIPAHPIAPDSPVPAHMLNGRRLKTDVPKGTIITYSMIEEPEDSMLWALRAEQDLM